ncbi:MAG: hypothetical protein BroJett040_25820 [Oligoflexia bacterium]|nr:MAG: hypothetical protein BroJett040_25820 [Oligoflexia bacterium]
MRSISATLLLLFSSSAFAVGFSHGNEFQSLPIYGEVTVSCQEGSNSGYANYQCQDLLLSPTEMDYFAGPANIDADQVVLTATRRDGSQKTKSSSYNSDKGRSTSRFNLWIATLFQTPLLQDGPNKVHYKMTRDGQVVSEGDFQANVTRGHSATCPRGYITSSTMADCQSPYSACQRYFSNYNYCQ